MLIAVALPMATAFAGMLLTLLANPEASIDEGWRIGWIGLGCGLLVGVVFVAWMQRLRTQR